MTDIRPGRRSIRAVGIPVSGERSHQKSDQVVVDAPTNLPVVALLLTYRRPAEASQVVRDLLVHEKLPSHQILLVVNRDGGLLGSAGEEQIETLRLAENLGPGGGFARGLEHLRNVSAANWIYLCEDDQARHALPSPRLAELIEAVERFEREVPGAPVGAVLASGRDIDMRTGRTYRHELGLSTTTRFEDVEYGPFWGALVRKHVVASEILPDEAMFWWAEDLDFWLRVRAAGFRVVVDTVAHKAAKNKASSGEPWCGYYMARNNFYLQRRHGNFRWTVPHVLKSARRFQLAPSGAHRVAIIRGLLDGVRGRTGRNPRFSR